MKLHNYAKFHDRISFRNFGGILVCLRPTAMSIYVRKDLSYIAKKVKLSSSVNGVKSTGNYGFMVKSLMKNFIFLCMASCIAEDSRQHGSNFIAYNLKYAKSFF